MGYVATSQNESTCCSITPYKVINIGKRWLNIAKHEVYLEIGVFVKNLNIYHI